MKMTSIIYQKKILIPMTMAIIIAVIFLVTDYSDRRLLRDLQVEFPAVSSNQELNSRIKVIYNPPEFRNAANHAFVIFSNSQKNSITASRDLDSSGISLDEVLSEGDSISKNRNSSVILVYNREDSAVFRFVIE